MRIFSRGFIFAAAMFGILAGATESKAVPFMSGSISISGNTLTVPLNSGSIVSLLDSFVAASANGGGGTGSFISCAVSCVSSTPNFNITTLPATMFTFTTGGDTFTVQLQSVSSIIRTGFSGPAGLLNDQVGFVASGEISDSLNNFLPTAFQGNFTANGSCTSEPASSFCTATPTSSYSASLSALARAVQTPEPASIALMGAGMVALGGIRRRRRG
jgi:hypothetical protein